MSCATTKSRDTKHKKILLMGLPNVGKSAIFSRFTGMHVMVSNYTGTTVEFTEGKMAVGDDTYTLIDVPGVYDIKQSVDDAERVAVSMLEEKPDAIVFVVDALNVESSVYLLMQVLEYKLPTVVALNRVDLLKVRSMRIDHRVIQAALNVPVVPTIALGGDSLDLVKERLARDLASPDAPHYVLEENELKRWDWVERITARALKPLSDNATIRQDRFAFLIRPWPGLPIAIGVLFLMFAAVIGIGMGLRQFLIMPLFEGIRIGEHTVGLFPWIRAGVEALGITGTFQRVLVGEYGFLIKGIEWPFGLVLPYVLSFYLSMSILEDTGYLPRLAVLLDGVFKKIGLPGNTIIPLLLGYGCGIPAILSTRSMRSRKQRVAVAVMISLAVPCVAQSSAFMFLLVEHSLLALVLVFMISVFAMVLAGFVMDRIKREPMPLTLTELPEMLAPNPALVGKKLLFRVRHYVKDGAIPMVIAIVVTAFLYEFGILDVAGRAMAPVVSGWLRLPEEAATPLIIGIVRRELAVLPLIDMNLSTVQLFTGAVVALFYVPCVAMIATLAKEFNAKVAVGTLLFTTTTAIVIGGLMARLGGLLATWLG